MTTFISQRIERRNETGMIGPLRKVESPNVFLQP
jgi:hypothetical protein